MYPDRPFGMNGYVWSHPGCCAILLKLFLVATVGLNFPLLVSAMAIKAFHAESGDYGLLLSVMAIGIVSSALLAARRDRTGFAGLPVGAAVFGANSLLKLPTEPSMWGRVMALRVGIALGGTPIGAQTEGWMANGPSRWALGVAKMSSACRLWASTLRTVSIST